MKVERDISCGPHILSIFHDQSLYLWSVLRTKIVMSRGFLGWSKFPVVWCIFSSRTKHHLLLLSKWNHWTLWSAQASALFCNVAIRGGTNVTYFLNGHCNKKDDFIYSIVTFQILFLLIQTHIALFWTHLCYYLCIYLFLVCMCVSVSNMFFKKGQLLIYFEV